MTKLRGASDALVAIVTCAVVFFFALPAIGLVGADEPRYAQIAREMLARHDWVKPLLHGVPWLEKPILYYWEAIISFRLFGVSDWAARLPVAVDTTLVALGIYLFMRRFRPGLEALAVMVFATGAGTVGFARAASTDMPLTAAYTLGMLCWLVWRLEQRRVYLAGFYIFMAVGVLAKGPVAPALAGLTIIVFALLMREQRMIWRTLWLPGIALFLAVASPWYILVQLRTGNFFHEFILRHNLERYTENVFQHVQPPWYYLIVLPAALLPWVVPAIAGAVQDARELRREDAEAQLRTFLFIWAVVPVVFFSFSASKLPGYILPAIPAWLLLAAEYLPRMRSRALAVAHAIITGVVFGALLLSQFFLLKLHPTPTALGIAGGAAAVTFVLIVYVNFRRGPAAMGIVTAAPVLLGLIFVLRAVAPAANDLQSARPIAREIAATVKGTPPIMAWNVRREVRYGLGFYCNERVGEFGTDPTPQSDYVLVVGHGRNARQNFRPPAGAVEIGDFAPQKLTLYWIRQK